MQLVSYFHVKAPWQEKIKNLERSLSKVVHEFEGERVRWADDAEADKGNAEASTESLVLQLKAKERELEREKKRRQREQPQKQLRN